jgi:hypothetical protein
MFYELIDIVIGRPITERKKKEEKPYFFVI